LLQVVQELQIGGTTRAQTWNVTRNGTLTSNRRINGFRGGRHRVATHATTGRKISLKGVLPKMSENE